MLTIAHIDYIRKMYFEKGLSYAEIENRTGHNYRTIKKYIELEDFNIPTKAKATSPKSDLIRPYVKEILKANKGIRDNSHPYYSVSPKYVGCYIWIKILANELIGARL